MKWILRSFLLIGGDDAPPPICGSPASLSVSLLLFRLDRATFVNFLLLFSSSFFSPRFPRRAKHDCPRQALFRHRTHTSHMYSLDSSPFTPCRSGTSLPPSCPWHSQPKNPSTREGSSQTQFSSTQHPLVYLPFD